jgi:hypothetical protein
MMTQEYAFVPNPVTEAKASQAALDTAEANFTAYALGLHIGPDLDKVAVKVPVWLWVTDPGVQTRDSNLLDDNVSFVRIYATVSSIDWNMGEPYNMDPGSPKQTVHCSGTGTPVSPDAQPMKPGPSDCSYTYWWKSTLERTKNTESPGKWPVSVTVNWSIRWEVITPNPAYHFEGVDPEPLPSNAISTAVHVGEYSTVLVAPTG